MKTIGYVLADFPVLSETFVGDEMRAMMDRGHRVVPIVMHLRNGPAQTEDAQLARRALTLRSAAADNMISAAVGARGRRRDALKFVRGQKCLPSRSLLWNGLKIAAIAKEQGCGHLHAHFGGGAAAHAIVAARLAGISVSFVCHGHDVYAEPQDLGLKLEAADLAVAVCNDLALDLKAQAESAKIAMVPCGVDASLFAPLSKGRTNGRFLFIGRLVPQKGLDDLLEAIAITEETVVDVVGDGPMKEACIARAAALNIADRVKFHGAKSREWLRKNASEYIALVAPFKEGADGARDTGPLVAKEAMALELPVVATRFMGFKEIVTRETGFLVEPGNPFDLAHGLDCLRALSEGERAEMGRRARERVLRHFTSQLQAAVLSNLFEAA